MKTQKIGLCGSKRRLTFEKAPDFEAQGWAEHMANTYNDRLMSDADDEFSRVTARSPDLHASLDL